MTQADADGPPAHRRNKVDGAWEDFGDEFEYEYIVMEDDTSKHDVEFGRRYWAVVNNIESYGVFVSLAGFDVGPDGRPDFRVGEDVAGLIHESAFPAGYDPNDFMVGDEVGVMLIERKRNGDINLELVAAFSTARSFTFERDPDKSPVRWYTQGVDRDEPLTPDPAPSPYADAYDGDPGPPETEADTDEADADADAPTTEVPEEGKYYPRHFARPDEADELFEILDDAFDRLADLARDVDDLFSPKYDAGADIGALRQDIDLLRADVDSIDNTLRSTRGWIGNVAEDTDDRLDELEFMLMQLEDRVTDLAAKRAADGEGLPGRFGVMERMLADLAPDHRATGLDLTETDSGVRLTIDAEPEEDTEE